MTSHKGIYPGTFDPITLGHMDIIRRATRIVNHLVIAVAQDTAKTPIFSLEERVEMVHKDVQSLVDEGATITVLGFEGLLVEFAKEHEAGIIIRGLRAVSDFEFEFQLSGMNSKLDPNIQTVFLPASESTHFVASRLVKEIVRLGGDVSDVVSEDVAKKLRAHYQAV